MRNIYLPKTTKIVKIKEEAKRVKTFTLSFIKKEDFSFIPGQFLALSVFGVGEAPISISSSPQNKECFDLTVQAIGSVTNALYGLGVGDLVGVRGPFGNGFPLDKAKGKDILVIGGGIGMAPLRSLVNFILNKRDDFGRIFIFHGARSPKNILFLDEIKNWKGYGVSISLIVEEKDNKWPYEVGLITDLFKKVAVDPQNTASFVCGPPFMIERVVEDYLIPSSFDPSLIFSTLERHMKCGVGHCGHCNVGPKYICIDGPVFSYDEMKLLPKEF